MDAEKDKYDLTQGVIWKKLMLFFLPVVAGTLFQMLYTTVDAAVVGKIVGSDALAAVGGSAAVIINLVVGLFIGLTSGAGVIIAQHFGARDHEGISKAVHSGITFCLVAGALTTAAGIALTPWSLRLLHNPEDITAPSIEYMRIYFTGIIPLMIYNMGSAVLRAIGDSKRPLYYLSACCAVNIVLDLLFVAVFKMGVAGAAWATVISLVVSAGLVLLRLCTVHDDYRLDLRKLGFDRRELRHMLNIGIPAGVQSAMYAISNIVIQVAINDLGTDVISAWTATGKLDAVFWAVSSSFGVTILAFAGQNFGAGNYERMKKSVRVCLMFALGFTVVISGALLLFGRHCLRIFVDEQVVISYAVEMLRCFAPYYIIWTFIEVISSSLRGAGDALRPMLITVIGVCGIRVAWMSLVVPVWHTIPGIAAAYPVSWSITALVFVVYFFRGKWLDRCVTKLAEGR